MHSMGTKYAGRRINGRMDDPQATYEFPSHFNSSYKGGFKDGIYCDGNQNRMFKSEMEKGMKPA
ncbi:hypothetical protein P5673_004028, partial [Acropora cervicornis]